MSPEFDINDFDCNENYAIDASAGTGKTYTITNLIVPELIKHGYSLDKILIVTYTEKAAGELRSRIRDALIKLRDNPTGLSPEEQAQIENAIEVVDDAPIGTINSFCLGTISENAIFANCAQNMVLIDEDAALERFIGQYIRDNAKDDPILLYLYNHPISKHIIRPITLLSVLQGAIKKYYLDKNGNQNADVVLLGQPSDNDKTIYTQSCDAIAKDLNALDGISKKQLEIILRCFVAQHLDEIYMAWQREKANKNLQTYTDMIKIVHDAIIEPDSKMLAHLKEKYQYAIIDEFQDTNKLQWNIFKQIFTTDQKHHITIVGDPKQSIYSFQGANSHIYNIAKKYIASHGVPRTLSKNYRSSDSMVDAINILVRQPDLCNYTSDDTYKNAKLSHKIRPALLSCPDTPDEEQEEIPVHFINDSHEAIVVSKIIEYCTIKNGKTLLQIWDKDINQKTGGYRNVNLGDFTILVSERRNANTVLARLTTAGIPYMWYKDTSLFSTREASDWIALLSAITANDFNAKNRSILSMALQTAFFNIAPGDILDERFDDIVCSERQTLLNWHNLAETKQYAKLINAIFDDTGLSKRFGDYNHLQSLTKYNQLGDFILDCLVSKHNSIATVIKILQQRKSKRTEEEDKISVERATSNPVVKISTIHAAKGLEFPIVFYILKNCDNISTFVRLAEQNDKTILETSLRSEAKNPDEESLKYVAITRAASLLFFVNMTHRKKHAITNTKDLATTWPDLFTIEKGTISSKMPAITCISDSDNTSPIQDYRINLSQKKLYKHSYTSLSHHDTDDSKINDYTTDKTERIDKEDESDTPDATTGIQYDSAPGAEVRGYYDSSNLAPIPDAPFAGKKFGTTVHEVFEHLCFTNFDSSNATKNDEYLDSIITKCCKKHLMEPAINQIRPLVINTMSAKLPEVIGGTQTGNIFTLSSVSDGDKRAELEFNLNPNINRPLINYCNGFIDLLFVRNINGHDVYSLLDWKTDLDDAKNYADYDALRSHTNEKYAIQRVLYSYFLIKWLKQFHPKMSESDIFDNYFGGIYYVYVRGCNAGTGNGIYAHTWRDYATLENAFKEIIRGIYNG